LKDQCIGNTSDSIHLLNIKIGERKHAQLTWNFTFPIWNCVHSFSSNGFKPCMTRLLRKRSSKPSWNHKHIPCSDILDITSSESIFPFIMALYLIAVTLILVNLVAQPLNAVSVHKQELCLIWQWQNWFLTDVWGDQTKLG
jgi:hypothetical protein